MFRIGYDAKRLYNNFTGLGNYSRTLLKNLAAHYPGNEYHLYTPRISSNPETTFFLDTPAFTTHTPGRRSGALWRSFSIIKDLKQHQIQLFHGLSHEIPFGTGRAGIPTIVTIHDLAFRRYPSFYPLVDRHIYDFKFRFACRNADRIVAISESTKKDIVEFYGIAPEKISVIYQSCHERFQEPAPAQVIEAVLQKYRLPREYFLFVGSLTERKNPLAILEAMTQLPADLQLPVVLVGEGTAYKAKLMEYMRLHAMERKVLFIKPAVEELPALYRQATVFLYPSFYEGFGIPILEALFSETPVITTNVSSLPEAAGPGSFICAPGRPEEMAEGIRKILSDEAFRVNMVEKGYQYAQRFRGAVLTTQMMELYEDVLKAGTVA